MSINVSYKKQSALGIILLLIFVAALEGISRGYEYFSICDTMEHEAYEDMNYFELKQICWEYRTIKYSSAPITKPIPEQYSNSMNINSQGFRGEEISIIKPNNTYRIFMVGGSTTFGTGTTSDDTTIPGYLQSFFKEKSMNVEVVNAGIPGAWSFEESYYVVNEITNYAPDLIIVYDGWNDAKKGILEPKLKEESNSIGFKNFKNFRTPFVIYDLFFNPENPPPELKDEQMVLKLIENWKNRWSQICELGNEKNFSVMVVVQPSIGTGKPLIGSEMRFSEIPEWHKQTASTMEKMAESLDDLKTNCMNTVDFTGILDDVNEPIFLDEVHVVDRGNEIIAKELFEEIMILYEKNNESN